MGALRCGATQATAPALAGHRHRTRLTLMSHPPAKLMRVLLMLA